jgi:hypothetical protein
VIAPAYRQRLAEERDLKVLLSDPNVMNIISFNNLEKVRKALLNAKPHEDSLYAGAGRLPTLWWFQYLAELN